MVGLGFKKINYNSYDPIIGNEVILLICSLVWVLFDEKKAEGFTLKSKNTLSIVFWMFILQSITIVALFVLIILDAPLPRFIYSSTLLVVFLKYVILAPVCEEIFMRGVIQQELSFLTGSVKIRSVRLNASVIVTSVLFGSMHLLPWGSGNIKDFLSTFTLGLVAGYHREKTESIFPAFIAHASYNFFGAFVGKLIYIFLG